MESTGEVDGKVEMINGGEGFLLMIKLKNIVYDQTEQKLEYAP